MCGVLVGVALLGTAHAQFGPDRASSSVPLDTIVAIAGNDVVTQRELQQAVRVRVAQLRRRREDGELPPTDIIERQVLEQLITERLQMQAVAERGITVDDTRVNDALRTVAERNKFSLDQLRQAVERDGMSFVDYREQIRREISFGLLRQREVDSQLRVTDQEIDNVLKNNFGDAEYRLAQILIPVSTAGSREGVNDARARSLEILGQLRSGADFARLAAAHSAGGEALEGGEIGWRRLNQIPALFASVVQNLQPGQVSDPVRSPSGFHLIKLLDRREGQLADGAEQAREQIRQELLRRKSEAQWEAWKRRLRDESYVDIRLP